MLTWVEINQTALIANIKAYRRLLPSDTKVMAVVKANAYGHGDLAVAKICAESGLVDQLCVAGMDEAVRLIQNKIRLPVLILSYFDKDIALIKKCVQSKVAFPLYTLDQAEILEKIAAQLKRTCKVHIKIDTGTTRVGILPKDALTFITKIKHNFPHLIIEGIWSHFASSENDSNFTKVQYQRFVSILHSLKKDGISIPLRHMACSAASIHYDFPELNAVRVGLGIYGLYASPKDKSKIKLKPVLSWKTKIIQIKEVPVGTGVGYGQSFIATKPTRIAVLPVGYADGFDRKLSNCGEVLIKGKKCPVRGRICMNLTMVDITKVPQVRIGDTVTLIGTDNAQTISADSIAVKLDTINYEVVARINPYLSRIVT